MSLKTLKVLMIAAAVAISAALPASASADAGAKVRIGSSVRSLFSLPLYVADQKGYFKEEGLDVEISFFRGGPPATAALLGGSIDLVAASFENQLKVNKRGVGVKTILNLQSDFSGALAVHESWLAGHPGKPDVRSLKGARIATLSRGGYADMALRYILQDAGLDPDKDATLIPVSGYDKVLAAAQAGELDAALFVEPWQTIAVEGSGQWQYVVDITRGQGPDVFKDMAYVTLQSSPAYLESHPQAAAKVVKAIVKAQGFIRDAQHLEELVQIAQRVFPDTDAGTLRASIAKQEHTFRPALKPDMIEKNMKLLLANKAIQDPAPQPSDVFELQYLKAAGVN
ncbi:ABC transporter substrate-binding protein [Pollutimonas bauzanensis]|uniref:NitT/TauT family transport system substrate-binding protein n=1 Tax=Pollutimonas bauzanensis TaxID=658167 RepID=A0A1M5VCN9_9BURK|nr:ABC transporter substrate-binding protein [Pollutimonas bauzanensis]SHH72683.1 NitT/TauT family transport system substrate-binding protein [Pollutimonas bauzanensis]